MNNIRSFLLELSYYDNATAEFSVKGAQFFLTVTGLSEAMARKLVKKHFDQALTYSILEKSSVFKLI